MSQGDGQPIRSLADLGGAWKALLLKDCQHPRERLVSKGSDRSCGVCGKALNWSEVADLPDRYERRPDWSGTTVPMGDLAPCACGKRSYTTLALAERQATALGNRTRAYGCHLGLPVWHLKAMGPSRRDRTGT